MSRITKQLREAMRNTLLDNAFVDDLKKAKQELLNAGEKIYQDIYGKHLIAMESLPKHWLEKSNHIFIGIGGQVHIVDFNDPRIIGYLHDSRHSCPKLYVGDEQVVLDYLKCKKAKDDIKDKRSKMYHEITALLESVTTFKKLWEVWPDCKPLLEKYEVKPVPSLFPAVQIKNINDGLGLSAVGA